MKILILNGSPRPNGNTAHLINGFQQAAEENNHEVQTLNLSQMKIKPCIGCSVCRNEGNGKCVFQDDMNLLIEKANSADLIVFASPVYYWGFSGQLQSAISRFYSIRRPAATKYALLVTADSEGAFTSVVPQFNSIVNYFKGENLGAITSYGDQNKSKEKFIEAFELGKRI